MIPQRKQPRNRRPIGKEVWLTAAVALLVSTCQSAVDAGLMSATLSAERELQEAAFRHEQDVSLNQQRRQDYGEFLVVLDETASKALRFHACRSVPGPDPLAHTCDKQWDHYLESIRSVNARLGPLRLVASDSVMELAEYAVSRLDLRAREADVFPGIVFSGIGDQASGPVDYPDASGPLVGAMRSEIQPRRTPSRSMGERPRLATSSGSRLALGSQGVHQTCT